MRTETELVVTGMDCPACERRAAAVARRTTGVAEASADHRTGRVRVTYDPAEADPAALTQRLASAGFTPAEKGEQP